MTASEPRRGASPWLFSARLDLTVFLGSAVVALGLLALAPWLGVSADGEAPGWTWITTVLLVDVAHVWSTAFVVYLDPVERRRRPWLYAGVPIAGWGAGIALYAAGDAVFWRALAYLAVFHFVRQQYGWVALYRARVGERDRVGQWLDGATVYGATLYPLLWWHAQLPREFAWFRDGDFAAGLPGTVATVAGWLYAALLVTYVGRAALAWRRGVRNPGKHIVVATTAACWYLGIVATNGDYAFTVTNVLIHGVPYLALVFVYGRALAAAPARPDPGHIEPAGLGAAILRAGWLPFLATLWAVAYVEELLWDRGVWHDHAWLFGGAAGDGDPSWHVWLVPLLAVPQLTHYLLDGVLWRRGNPRLAPTLLSRR